MQAAMSKSRLPFLLKTAFRDSRKNIGKLILFMSSIIAGVAALVAINSFNHNLSRDIDLQAASLLGADLAVTSNKQVDDSTMMVYDSLPGEKSSELEVFSMSYLPKTRQTSFVRIKGLEGAFPYYGKIKTIPEAAAKNFKEDSTALVDESMMLQYNLVIGDSIKLGEKTFVISAKLLSTFGSAAITSSFAPTVYISKSQLLKTELVKEGSLVNYSFYYKVPKDFDIETWKEERRPVMRADAVRAETIEDRKDNLNEAFSNLNYFLNLVAMVALLLGSIGVASSVFIYIKTKIPSIAVMRCLGLKVREAFTIYFVQIIVLGFVAVLIGALVGSGIQVLLPKLLKDFLPVDVNLTLSYKAVIDGIIIGTVITALFAMLPLLEVRHISPLRTLRSSFDEATNYKDNWRWLLFSAILMAIFLFMFRITTSWQDASVFTVGLLIAFLVLYGVSTLIIKSLRKVIPQNAPFAVRQGFSNLYRPNNQTRILILSLGLGTAILTTLYLIQGLLLGNVAMMDSGNQPNTILYGIEKEQIKAVKDTTRAYRLPVIQDVPIVTMKLEAWKGKSKNEWMKDTIQSRDNRWAMNREARVTYRDTIGEKEQLVRGNMNRPVKNFGDSIYVSLADSYAEALGVDLGDEMVFNVQGTVMKTYVGSIRKIEFNNMSTRFFIIFPTGVLEEAPQFSVLVTKSPDAKTTAAYRSSIVRSFPNVSVVDLGSILSSVMEILNKVSYVIKFMAFFSLITGIIVLISSLLLSKFQRIGESVLLRTLGAKRKVILQINIVEYFILGLLSSIIGVVLSLLAAFMIAKLQFKLDFYINWLPIMGVIGFITLVTVLIGLFNSREVVSKPPLEVLRKEG